MQVLLAGDLEGGLKEKIERQILMAGEKDIAYFWKMATHKSEGIREVCPLFVALDAEKFVGALGLRNFTITVEHGMHREVLVARYLETSAREEKARELVLSGLLGSFLAKAREKQWHVGFVEQIAKKHDGLIHKLVSKNKMEYRVVHQNEIGQIMKRASMPELAKRLVHWIKIRGRREADNPESTAIMQRVHEEKEKERRRKKPK